MPPGSIQPQAVRRLLCADQAALQVAAGQAGGGTTQIEQWAGAAKSLGVSAGQAAEAGRGWVKLCVAAARQIRCSAAERVVAGCRKKQTEARDSRRCRRQRSSAHGMSWPPSLAKPHVAPASFSPSRQLLPTTISCRAQSAVHAHRTQHLIVASCRAAKLLPQHLALDPAPSDKPRRACR